MEASMEKSSETSAVIKLHVRSDLTRAMKGKPIEPPEFTAGAIASVLTLIGTQGVRVESKRSDLERQQSILDISWSAKSG
jgi:hypothetical protein